MGFRIAIDTGGTFTDAISVDGRGNLATGKAATTPEDLTVGVRNAVGILARLNHLDLRKFLGQVTTIVHGTTQSTNIIITRTGPKLGMICTEGHRDVIQLRRVPKEDMWNWRMPFPEPLVPRYLRVEIKERVDARGNIAIPLDEASVHKAVSYLKKMKVESIVVALLFSFLRPDHECRVEEIIGVDYPEAHVTLSSSVLPMMGEYERTSTATISAYVAPAIVTYTQKLVASLRADGFQGQFLYIQNNGGVETAEVAMENPATVAMSGPAAGPSAAILVGKLHSQENLLSVDMGGTSFDIATIVRGNLLTKTESLIDQHRFSLPVIDVSSMSAGGGSIAWFDVTNTLRIGPKSAGADPGPACYARGGTEPTVTDANVVLGYISPDYFLGGEMTLRKDLAEKAIKEKIADRLGLSIEKAAAAVYKVSNAVMADAVSYSFTRRGYDPRDFVLCAGGAAGPLCALKIAEELGMTHVFIPKYAPVYCAFGMLGVDLKHDYSRFYHTPGAMLDLEHVKKLYDEMEAEGLAILEKEGVAKDQRIFERSLQIRYFGQFRDVGVPWPSGPINRDSISAGIAAFHRKHKETYGYSDENYPIEFMSFGLSAIGKIPPIEIKKIGKRGKDPSAALKSERNAYFEEGNGFVKTRVYDGDKLLCGNLLEGPCIVEEKMTNIVIPSNFKMSVDEYGNYITAD